MPEVIPIGAVPVEHHEARRGVLLCGTGPGMSHDAANVLEWEHG